ncbi:MAG TPA: pyridoxal-dependent decarboxylase [Gaiellales bacterium]|jgi:glutamate/tyrosine decarboxylase-like PLP-dependent enzyme
MSATPTERPAPVADLDWDSARMRSLADRAVELYGEFLDGLDDMPIARDMPAQRVREAVVRPVPEEGLSDDELVAHLHDVLIEWGVQCGHPRFLAYVTGSGTVPGAVAEMLAAAVNMNVGGWQLSPSASEIEHALMRWFADRFGLPAAAGGLLVSGGAMANMVCLKAARDHAAGWDTRRDGMAAGPPLAIYATEETHVVTDRAADALGLGTAAVRRIPVDGRLRMVPSALAERIAGDRAAGVRPMAVVGTAGTTSTGAIDPLDEIAAVCAAEGVWLHVDAAYGGPAVLAEGLRPLLRGIERADSVAFDPHKWLYIAQSAGCALVRDAQHLADAYQVHATYVWQDRDRTGAGVSLGELGPQYSRGFQALKVWASLLAHGSAAYGRRIAHDAALAHYMASRVEERPEFELATPVGLSICCFAYVPAQPAPQEYASRLNERIMTELQLDGRAYISNAILGGRFVLRACFVNHRTEADDVDAVLDVVAELGSRLDGELRAGS